MKLPVDFENKKIFITVPYGEYSLTSVYYPMMQTDPNSREPLFNAIKDPKIKVEIIIDGELKEVTEI